MTLSNIFLHEFNNNGNILSGACAAAGRAIHRSVKLASFILWKFIKLRLLAALYQDLERDYVYNMALFFAPQTHTHIYINALNRESMHREEANKKAPSHAHPTTRLFFFPLNILNIWTIYRCLHLAYATTSSKWIWKNREVHNELKHGMNDDDDDDGIVMRGPARCSHQNANKNSIVVYSSVCISASEKERERGEGAEEKTG